jgi:hypothetical protein
VQTQLRAKYDDIQTYNVARKMLDDYLPWLQGHKRVMLKIDTEGAEISVLKGGQLLLDCYKPWIVFEALPNEVERAKLFEFLNGANYDITQLPWRGEAKKLQQRDFSAHEATNFLALPRGGA